MELKYEFEGYLKYLNKYKYAIIFLFFSIELMLFIKIGRTNIFTFACSFFIVPFVICSMLLLFKDFKTMLYIYVFSMPVLQMVLYILARINMQVVGNSIYIVYFVLFIINCAIEYRNGKINLSRFLTDRRYKKIAILYSILTVLALLSVAFCVHKLEAFYLIFLGMFSMIIYSIVIICHTDQKSDYYKNIILYLCAGVVLSGVPDALVSTVYLIVKRTNTHLYSVLGGNFMLGYTLIVLPFILYYAFNSKDIQKKVSTALLVLEVITLSTQISRGIFIALIICFLSIMFIDKKNWYRYLIVSMVVLFCVGFNVSHRWEMSNIEQDISNIGVTKTVKTQFINKGAFLDRILEQARNRVPIWGVTLTMVADHPFLGVGPGHYKYNYLEYGGEISKSYKDAHNLILDVTSELGVPFALIFFISLFIIIIKALILSRKTDNEIKASILKLGSLGLVCLLIFGNITGQAFMTFVYPISPVPAFVFTIVITLMILCINNHVEDNK